MIFSRILKVRLLLAATVIGSISYGQNQTPPNAPPVPLTLGLLVDTSPTRCNALDEERQASYRFLEAALRGNEDRAFVIHFDRQVELLTDLTSSRAQLNRILNLLRCSAGPGATLYDSILLASNNLTKQQQGRKALILLTSGVDNGSNAPVGDAIKAAQQADTLVYSILFPGENQRPGGREVLQQISAETGGGFFEVSNQQSIDDIYARIQEKLRVQ